MAIHIRRREFIVALSSAAAWPLAARAQQPLPMIGFINGGSADSSARFVTAFREGLSKTGFVEGQNVAVEYYWLEGKYAQLPALVADLVRRRVALIATPASGPCCTRGESCNVDDSDRLQRRPRPSPAWSCGQSCPAGRQRHRPQLFQPGGGGQAAAAPA
jgi:hypothetical protein